MKWRTRLAQLLCNHQFNEVATFKVMASGYDSTGLIKFIPTVRTITTYECKKCGRLIDK